MDEGVAVVTGANRGLGRATAASLAARGYRVVLCARERAKAEAAIAELRAKDNALQLVSAHLDVREDEQVAALFERIDRELGRVDVLVNNAGAILEQGDARTVPAAVIAQTFDINTLGAYRMSQAALERMNGAGYGRIVNVSSGMGSLTDMGSGWPGYRISKAALSAVTLLFANHARGDVLVNAVCPGWVQTDMGGAGATRTVDEATPGIVWAATLEVGGPSGGFFRDGEPVPW